MLLASGGVLRVLTVSGDRGGDGADDDGGGDDGGGEVDGTRERTGPPARVVRSAARTDTGDYVVLEDPSGAARLVRLNAP